MYRGEGSSELFTGCLLLNREGRIGSHSQLSSIELYHNGSGGGKLQVSICRRPDSHPCFFSVFGDVAFPEYFLYHFGFFFVWIIEYVVRSILPNGVFLPCDHGLNY